MPCTAVKRIDIVVLLKNLKKIEKKNNEHDGMYYYFVVESIFDEQRANVIGFGFLFRCCRYFSSHRGRIFSKNTRKSTNIIVGSGRKLTDRENRNVGKTYIGFLSNSRIYI